jgi:hypothetical protein
MNDERRRPSHRLVIQHSEDSKYTTEVGAMWPHSKGGGFSITIKPGLSVATMAGGARLIAFVIDHEAREDERAGDHANGRRSSRDDLRANSRERGSGKSVAKSKKQSKDGDDIPF